MSSNLIENIIPKNTKVLVAPLNWGLGHASRCIPIIDELFALGCHVDIASDGAALALLKKEFVSASFFELPSYNIKYTSSSMELNMLRQLPKIFTTYRKEYRLINKLQENHNWDYIISDNRFGIRSNSSFNIVISHQIQIQSKVNFLGKIASAINRYFINRFNQCWILDDKNNSIAGDLSKNIGLQNSIFIGPKTRLVKYKTKIKQDVVILLSGPEPSRTRLENKLLDILNSTNYSVLFIRGLPCDKEKLTVPSNITIKNFQDSRTLNESILSSKLVICRSGYSSIMDLIVLKKKAIIIPTPGQTEQEYLAKFHLDNKQFFPIDEIKLRSIDQIESVLLGD